MAKRQKPTFEIMSSTVDALEAALALGVTRQRVSALLRAGRLEAVCIGRRRKRITRASLEACLADRQRRGIQPTPKGAQS